MGVGCHAWRNPGGQFSAVGQWPRDGWRLQAQRRGVRPVSIAGAAEHEWGWRVCGRREARGDRLSPACHVTPASPRGRSVSLVASPKHEVPTPGWISTVTPPHMSPTCHPGWEVTARRGDRRRETVRALIPSRTAMPRRERPWSMRRSMASRCSARVSGPG